MEFNYLKVSGSVRKVLQMTFAVCTILLANTAFAQISNGKLDQKLQELVTKEALFQEDAQYVQPHQLRVADRQQVPIKSRSSLPPKRHKK